MKQIFFVKMTILSHVQNSEDFSPCVKKNLSSFIKALVPDKFDVQRIILELVHKLIIKVWEKLLLPFNSRRSQQKMI